MMEKVLLYILVINIKKEKFFSLSKKFNLDEAASNLYKVLRLIKKGI